MQGSDRRLKAGAGTGLTPHMTPREGGSPVTGSGSDDNNSSSGGHLSSSTMVVDNTSKLIATIAGTRNVPAVMLPHDFTHIKGTFLR